MVEGLNSESVAKRAKRKFVPSLSCLRDRECSWCKNRCPHRRVRTNAASRDEYKCGACGGGTLPCANSRGGLGCPRMAKAGSFFGAELCYACEQSLQQVQPEARHGDGGGDGGGDGDGAGLYEALGLRRDAEAAEVRRAYYRMALRWHPDKNPADSQAAAERFKRVGAAYDVLSHAARRAEYDDDSTTRRGRAHRDGPDDSAEGEGWFGSERSDAFEIFREFFAKHGGPR